MSHSVERATELDVADWLVPASEVGGLFGADMANDPGFRDSVRRNIVAGAAFCVRIDGALAGAMLFKGGTIAWLAVAKAFRRRGVARALVAHAQAESRPIRVTTFGAGHPHPDSQAARDLYRCMGFQTVTEGAVPGPDGTPRVELVWNGPEVAGQVDGQTMTDALSIRPYRAADRAALEELWQRVFPDDPPWNAPALMIEAKLRVQPELLLVGEHGASIVGAVIGGFDGVRGWIYHLAVAPELRRRGFGRQLVRAAEHGLRRLGCSKVNLQVRATNHEVVAFYRSLGYEVEERVSMGRRLDAAAVPRNRSR